MIIAGPCSAESEEQVLTTARQLKDLVLDNHPVDVFRAGIWKPRTHPGCFEGRGEIALPWLRRVKDELGMRVCTEVASREHVEACLNAGIDMLWIGARTTANPFLVQEIADALEGKDIPVLVKNPISPDIELWIGAVERFRSRGVTDLGLVHRGFSSFEKTAYRNAPSWQQAIEMRARFPELPFFCDPSHIAGSVEYIREISQHALDLGLDGLMIEAHCDPSHAMSDAGQQIEPAALGKLLKSLAVRCPGVPAAQERLAELREDINAVDEDIVRLLGKRMRISREIGKVKKDNNMSIIQAARWETVLSSVRKMGGLNGLDPAFLEKCFSTIHEASVSEQNKILEGKTK